MIPYKNVYCFYTMAYLIHHGWTDRKEILHEANMVWRESLLSKAKRSKKKK